MIDGLNSQTQLCIYYEIKGFNQLEINGKLIFVVISYLFIYLKRTIHFDRK